MESVEIRKLIISLKEKESDFGSISPKMELTRNKIKKEITELQLRINKLRKEEGTPLNRKPRIR